jgi:phenylpropionate dioxygenase-like ring-hydroxylating dioxygenase large terminal subunit
MTTELEPWTKLSDRITSMRSVRKTDFAPDVYRVPASDYTDLQNHAAEIDKLFHQWPVLAGLSGAADGPGGWFTVDLGGVGVIVVRGEDNELRAFRNACPHRGMQLLQGFGTGLKRINCPFHAWSFDHLGTNRAIPARDAFDSYEPGELDLCEVNVAESHGLIYVSLATNLTPELMNDTLGGIHRELDFVDVSGQVLIDRQERTLKMNWKLGVDSYMEGDHLHFLHRASLRPFFFNDASPFDAFGPNSRIAGVRRTLEGADLSNPSDLLEHVTLEYQLFPNAVLIQQQDHLELSQVFPVPGDPGQSIVVQSVYAPREGLTEERRSRFRKSFELLLGVTVAEDFAACEQIQRNLAGGSPTHLRLGRNEPGLVHFHQTLHRRLSR